jgi:hypothetical protein
MALNSSVDYVLPKVKEVVMIGLIIGVLWFVFAALVGKQAPEAAVVNISNFLFYWYVGWWSAIAVFWFGVWLISCLADKTAGLAMTIAAPIFLLMSAISTALYSTSAYLVYHAGDSATPIPEWDMGYLIAAGVCVGLALVFGLFTRITMSGSKD